MISTLSVDKTWQLHDALDLIRSLQVHVKPIGFHISLGGGVLNTGSSKKDLDLYFLPMSSVTDATQTDKLLAFLTETWGPGSPMTSSKKRSTAGGFESYFDEHGVRRLRNVPIEEKPDYPTLGGESCYTHKLKFRWSDLRIDVFVVGAPATAGVKTAVAEVGEGGAAPDPLRTFRDSLPSWTEMIQANQAGRDAANRLRDLLDTRAMQRQIAQQGNYLLDTQLDGRMDFDPNVNNNTTGG